MTQLSLYDDIDLPTCPTCGGDIAVTDAVVNVAMCENCGLTVIKHRGRWRDFRQHFGGGEKPRKKPKPRPPNERHEGGWRICCEAFADQDDHRGVSAI